MNILRSVYILPIFPNRKNITITSWAKTSVFFPDHCEVLPLSQNYHMKYVSLSHTYTLQTNTLLLSFFLLWSLKTICIVFCRSYSVQLIEWTHSKCSNEAMAHFQWSVHTSKLQLCVSLFTERLGGNFRKIFAWKIIFVAIYSNNVNCYGLYGNDWCQSVNWCLFWVKPSKDISFRCLANWRKKPEIPKFKPKMETTQFRKWYCPECILKPRIPLLKLWSLNSSTFYCCQV